MFEKIRESFVNKISKKRVYALSFFWIILLALPPLHAEDKENMSSDELLESFLKKSKLSPLDKAILSHDFEMVQSLVDGGTAINPKDTSAGHPLMYAVIADDLKITEYLLNKGAKVDSEIEGGVTPLSMAVHWNLEEMAKLLIRFKANVHKTLQGSNLVDVADQSYFINMSAILKEAGAKPSIKVQTPPEANKGKTLTEEKTSEANQETTVNSKTKNK